MTGVGGGGWASIPKAIPDLFAKNRSSTAGGNVTSVVGAAEYTGEVFAAPVGWQTKVTVVLLIVISLNIFVGLFNLLPLLPLDGGHLAVVIYERIRAWLARLLREAGSGPGGHAQAAPGQRGSVRPAGRLRPAAHPGRPR